MGKMRLQPDTPELRRYDGGHRGVSLRRPVKFSMSQSQGGVKCP